MVAPASPPAAEASADASPERIRSLLGELDNRISVCSRSIGEINLQTRILAMNAQIEAARAGSAGQSFSVVGREMTELSLRTDATARSLEDETRGLLNALGGISGTLAHQVRGTRLVDLALTNIDLIDRNLYERSCDCRWWATDPGLVAALESPSPESASHATQRMAVILKAYTVYFDIVLAGLDGRIVANGRPNDFSSVGHNCSGSAWFRSAMATASGDEFGFQTAHDSPLVGGKRILAYSCKVCRGGQAEADVLGVLAVLFRWEALGEHIVRNTPVPPADLPRTRVCITDGDGNLLADSAGHALTARLDFPERASVYAQQKAFRPVSIGGRTALVAHARSPGFETYATGWHSVIIQHD